MGYPELHRYARKGIQYVSINICNTRMNPLMHAVMNGCEFAYYKEREREREWQTNTDRQDRQADDGSIDR